MGKSNKRKPSPASIPAKRTPRRLRGIAVDEGNDHRPLWRLTLLDQEHDDGWSWKIDARTVRKIVVFLAEMERLTWREIWDHQTGGRRRGAKHKFIPIEHLCETAQFRLGQLELVEWDHLFRFRMGNKERLWGVISEENPRVFYPIWWDPDHRVCPSKDQE